MKRLNITSEVLDLLGFSEYWDEHGDWGGRTLEFDNGLRFRIIEQEAHNEGNGPYGEYLYISNHYLFSGWFAIPAIKAAPAHLDLFFLDEMYNCIAIFYPDVLEEFRFKAKKVYMDSYLPSIADYERHIY